MYNFQWINNQHGYILIGGRRLFLVDWVMNILCWVVVQMVEWVLFKSYREYVFKFRGIIVKKLKVKAYTKLCD